MVQVCDWCDLSLQSPSNFEETDPKNSEVFDFSDNTQEGSNISELRTDPIYVGHNYFFLPDLTLIHFHYSLMTLFPLPACLLMSLTMLMLRRRRRT